MAACRDCQRNFPSIPSHENAGCPLERTRLDVVGCVVVWKMILWSSRMFGWTMETSTLVSGFACDDATGYWWSRKFYYLQWWWIAWRNDCCVEATFRANPEFLDYWTACDVDDSKWNFERTFGSACSLFLTEYQHLSRLLHVRRLGYRRHRVHQNPIRPVPLCPPGSERELPLVSSGSEACFSSPPV